ncbi:hypothetical protein Tco_0745552 [Tanacetum coccineum]
MVGSDIDGYTARFHELAKLVPHMVTPESQCVNRYIWGLAPEIKPHVTSSKPATIQGAVSMAKRLTIDGIKDGLFKKKENAGNKRRSNNQNRNRRRDDRNKRQRTGGNFALTVLKLGQGQLDVTKWVTLPDTTQVELLMKDQGQLALRIDWLSKLRAKIVCYEKIVQISLSNGDILEVHRERPEGNLKQLKTMKVNEPKLKDIPVVREFPGVFLEDLSSLPPSREVVFRIDLIPRVVPVLKSPYRLASTEMQELSNQLKELQEKGSRYFSNINLQSGYHQLRVHEEDIPKTAFKTRSYLDKFVIVFINDILIYSKSKEEHEVHLKLILNLLEKKKLLGKFLKCEFWLQQVHFLGYVVNSEDKGLNNLSLNDLTIHQVFTPRCGRIPKSYIMGFCSTWLWIDGDLWLSYFGMEMAQEGPHDCNELLSALLIFLSSRHCNLQEDAHQCQGCSGMAAAPSMLNTVETLKHQKQDAKRYGSVKNHKKTVKNRQARTRESEEYKKKPKNQSPGPCPFITTTRANLAIVESHL